MALMDEQCSAAPESHGMRHVKSLFHPASHHDKENTAPGSPRPQSQAALEDHVGTAHLPTEGTWGLLEVAWWACTPKLLQQVPKWDVGGSRFQRNPKGVHGKPLLLAK